MSINVNKAWVPDDKFGAVIIWFIGYQAQAIAAQISLE